MRAFYFGCVDDVGHYMHNTELQHVHGGRYYWPLPQHIGKTIDSGYCPKGTEAQGQALLHNLEGWTILSFWDRSVDRRPGSNSNFIFEATLTADEAIAQAARLFPKVWDRFPFEIAVRP